jgi:hypothetical protein
MNSTNIWDTIKKLKNKPQKLSVIEMITNINTQGNKNKLSYDRIPSKYGYLPETSNIKYMRPKKTIPNYLGSSARKKVEPILKLINYSNNTFQTDFTNNSIVTKIDNSIITKIDNLVTDTTPPVVIVGLDHYNDGSSTYIITLYNWSSYSSITTLDIWVSNSSDYSNSVYLKTTDIIENNDGVYTTTFTHIFTNNYSWITLINTDPVINTDLVINLQVTQPITNNPNFSFSLDNILHTGLYNIILDNWKEVYTNNIQGLYVFAHINSDYSDIPIQIAYINTSLIVNNSGIYSIPLNFKFYIDRNYYLSVSDTSDFSGIFNVELTNNINALTITATISPSYGFINNDNVFTITLSNNESYDLTEYLVSWNIFNADNPDGYNATLITSSTLNNNQTLIFTYNPENLSSVYFCIGNTSIITPPGFISTNISEYILDESEYDLNQLYKSYHNINFIPNQLVISDKISKKLELSVIEPKFKILPKI